MLVRQFNHAMDAVLPDPEALKYVPDLKILSFIKESARNRYRDGKLSIKDASNKIRGIVEEYLVSKGVDPKIPPTPNAASRGAKTVAKRAARRTAFIFVSSPWHHIIFI
ncbi:MAG: type restriction enzyme subunit [Tepidanaerobacteraceae bacterium]|nr:type restriction enzyme subunit [Tepidanaerobacteraceae bacterium]